MDGAEITIFSSWNLTWIFLWHPRKMKLDDCVPQKRIIVKLPICSIYKFLLCVLASPTLQ
jgi:hypothetical protein